jgi:hypothetical protein
MPDLTPTRGAAVVAFLLATCGPASAQDWPEAIADNSFLIEEAYNQEPGVVQHITSVALADDATIASFTQEWPLFTQRHQLSYSVLWLWPEGGADGFGDVLVNYRYQLTGEDQWAAIAPRVSLVVPTGDEDRGLGTGTTGVQFNLPVSRRAGKWLAWHLNAGGTVVPDSSEDAWFVGASLIGLLHPRLNLLVEGLRTDGPGDVEWVVNPGLRAAIDVGGLQIVPGVSVPFSRVGGQTTTSAFLYLSLEHPFR